MQDDKVIEALGGYVEVATALAAMHPEHTFNPETVYIWRYRRRVPLKWRYSIAQIAKKKIKGFDADAFMRQAAAA